MAPTDYSEDSDESEYSETQQSSTKRRSVPQGYDHTGATISPQLPQGPQGHHQHINSYVPPFPQQYGETDARYVQGQSLSDFYFLQSPDQSPDVLRQPFRGAQSAQTSKSSSSASHRASRSSTGVSKRTHNKRRSHSRRLQAESNFYALPPPPPTQSTGDQTIGPEGPSSATEAFPVAYGSPGPPSWQDNKEKQEDRSYKFGLGIGLASNPAQEGRAAGGNANTNTSSNNYDASAYDTGNGAQAQASVRTEYPPIYVQPPEKNPYRRQDPQPAGYELPRPAYIAPGQQTSPGGLTPALGLHREHFEGYIYDAYMNGSMGAPQNTSAITPGNTVSTSMSAPPPSGSAAPLFTPGVHPVLPSPIPAYTTNDYNQQMAIANYNKYHVNGGSGQQMVSVPGDDGVGAYEPAVAAYEPEGEFEYAEDGSLRPSGSANSSGAGMQPVYQYYDTRYAGNPYAQDPHQQQQQLQDPEDPTDTSESALLMVVPGPNYSADAVNAEWNDEQVYDLMRLLEHGERHKWKYMSEILTECQNKRISMRACKSKFEAMFGETESASLLRSSLFYTAYRTGWETIRKERIESERQEMENLNSEANVILTRTNNPEPSPSTQSSEHHIGVSENIDAEPQQQP